jgi:hypothetical protein
VGTLTDYFSYRAAAYVPPFDAEALREAANRLAASPAEGLRQAQAATEQLLSRDLTTRQFALQHVRITDELLRRRAAPQGRAAEERRTPVSVHSQSRGGL